MTYHSSGTERPAVRRTQITHLHGLSAAAVNAREVQATAMSTTSIKRARLPETQCLRNLVTFRLIHVNKAPKTPPAGAPTQQHKATVNT